MDTARFSSDVGKAAQQMARLTAEAGKIGAAIGANIGAGARAFKDLVVASIESADKLSKMSQSYGIAVEDLSAYAYAADLAGVSQEELAIGLGKLAKKAVDAAGGSKEAAAAFASMGIDVQDSSGAVKSQDELLGDIADKFKGYKDGAEKTALAIEVFGKSGAKLIPFLNQGRDGLQTLKAEAQKLGLVLSGPAGAAAEQFNDNLRRLTKAKEGLGLRIAEQLLPTLQMLTDKFIGTAQSSENMARSAEIAATGVKLLISAGTLIIGVFKTVGQYLGGIGAAAVALFSGRFQEAYQISKEVGGDLVSNIRGVAADVSDIWTTTGNTVVANADKTGSQIAAPIVVAADKAKVARERLSEEAKAIQKINDDAAKAYLDARRRLDDLGLGEEDAAMRELDRLQAAGAAKPLVDQIRQLTQAYYAEKAAQEMTTEAARDRAKVEDELRRIYEETRTPIEKLNIQLARLAQLRQVAGADQDALARAEFDAWDAYSKTLDKVEEKQTSLASISKDLGMTFSSQFEDAILSGEKFSTLLKSLDKDITRILLRRLVTEPLAGGVSGFVSGLGGGAGSGTGFDWGKLLSGWLKGAFGSGAAGTSGGGGWMDAVGGWLKSAFSGWFAEGGYIPPGRWGMAGEEGPEPVFGGSTGASVRPATTQVIQVSLRADPTMSRGTAMQQGAAIGLGIQRALARNG